MHGGLDSARPWLQPARTAPLPLVTRHLAERHCHLQIVIALCFDVWQVIDVLQVTFMMYNFVTLWPKVGLAEKARFNMCTTLVLRDTLLPLSSHLRELMMGTWRLPCWMHCYVLLHRGFPQHVC